MQIHIWKGYHSTEVRELIAQVWSRSDELLILCPPLLNSFDFLKFLPEGEITWHGEWENPPSQVKRESVPYPETPVMGLFSSGTTSEQSKLILYSKSNVRASLDGILRFFETSRLDSIFCYPQPFHTFGLLLGYVLSLENDWPMFTSTGKYGTHFHAARAEVQLPGLLTLGTPTHLQDLMAYVRSTGVTLAQSYSAIVGGARVTVPLWRDLQTVLNIESPSIGYGATEASPGVAHLPAGKEPLEDGEIGYPLQGLQLTLQESGYEFEGPSVCLAIVYPNRIDFPKRIFISDLIRRRDDGSLVFQSRSDLLLNRGGEKFSLEKIEGLLAEKFALRAIACTVPDRRLGQELALLACGGQHNRDEIYRELHSQFGVKFNPAYFMQAQELPLNSSLKPDRQKAKLILGSAIL